MSSLKAQSTSKMTQQSAVPAVSSKRRRRKVRIPVGRKREGPRMLPPYLELMADPLEAPLEFTHPPDSNNRPTIVWRTAQAKTITIATGVKSLFVEITPSLKSAISTTNIGTDDVVPALVWSDWDDYASMASSFSHYRPMAMVAELEYIGPADTAQGVIWGMSTENGVAATTTFASLTDESTYSEGSVTNGAQAAVCLRYPPMDWIAITSTPTLTCGAARMNFGVSGGVAGHPYRLRITFVAEYRCAIGSLMATQAQESPSIPSLLGAAGSIIGSAVTSIVSKEAWEDIKRESKRLALQAARANGIPLLNNAINELARAYGAGGMAALNNG